MFEKDEDYRKAKSECKARITKAIKVWSGREEAIRDASFKDGAEFGYNKANEWHYVKDGDLPKDNSFVLVWTIDGGITTNYGEEYTDGIPENGLFQGIHISDVIAWKEIHYPQKSER